MLFFEVWSKEFAEKQSYRLQGALCSVCPPWVVAPNLVKGGCSAAQMEACTQWSGPTAISGKTEGRHQEMLYLHYREHRLQIQAPRPRAKTSCLTAAPGYLQPLLSPLSPSPALQRRVSQSRTALISQQDLLSTGASL